MTARDEKRELEAVEKLLAEGLSDYVWSFISLMSQTLIAAPPWQNSKFGKLDILVNNAGIAGVVVDVEAFKAVAHEPGGAPKVDWSKMASQPYEAAAECLQTNYYGVKRVVAALLPLLQLSDHPIIVNVSSSAGKLKNIPSQRIRGILDDTENLTEEKLDDLLDEFLKDMKEGALESKGWPQHMAAYFVSKAALNAYARILAEKYPNVCINSVCPGYVKTDINYNTGVLSVEDGAASVVRLALLEKGAPSGRFFIRQEDTDY
uniref:(+)-neomenthol dehydrogenase-like n=1 Tax=Kalanchoe fedtschenkoi TaxID=63787 RepID=A0A7N0UXU7_KALFE